MASAQSTLPLAWLDKNEVSIKPENFGDAYSRMKFFNKDEIFGGDLNLEFWTNKGDEVLVWGENQILLQQKKDEEAAKKEKGETVSVTPAIPIT